MALLRKVYASFNDAFKGDSKMSFRLGLIGKNIGYSKSPMLHLEIARTLDVDLLYEIIDIEKDRINFYIEQLRKKKYQGFNVTIPYKTVVMPFLDYITPQAASIGAVNTIYIEHGLVVGHNTDYDGFIKMIQYHNIVLDNQKVCILGSGGAAKAIYHALLSLGVYPKVISRDKMNPYFKEVMTYEDLNENTCDLIVQATPVGTYPNIHASILPKVLVHHKTVIDLIYNPKETQMMLDAKKGYNGTMMLVFQGIASAHLFYNRELIINDAVISRLKEVIENE
jgi:shikimate dehydrogenase